MWLSSFELGLLYEVAQEDHLRTRRWSLVTERENELVQFESNHGALRHALSTRKRFRLTNAAFLALMEFKSTDLSFKTGLQRRFDQLYEEQAVAIAPHLVQQKLGDVEALPVAESLDLVRRFAARSVSASEIWAVSMASLGGGVTGALLTALLS
jgi:hypothetical protein